MQMEPSPFHRILAPVCRVAAVACGWGLLILCLLTVVEIVGRKLFGFTLQGIDEIGGYALAISTAVGFSLALLRRAHTRVDLVLSRLPRRGQALLNIVAMLSMAAFALFIAVQGWWVVQESLEFRSVSNSPLQVPMWLPQGAWVAGLALFATTAMGLAVHAVLSFMRDGRAVNALYGPPTVLEEIEEEVGLPRAIQHPRAAE